MNVARQAESGFDQGHVRAFARLAELPQRWSLRWASADILRWGELVGLFTGVVIAARWGGLTAALLIAVSVMVGLHGSVWRGRVLNASIVDCVPRALVMFGVPTNVVVAAYLALGHESLALGALRTGVLLLVSWLVARSGATWVVRRRRTNGLGLRNAVVVGADIIGQRLGRSFRTETHRGVRFVGFVDDATPSTIDGGPILGGADRLAEIVRDHAVDIVVVTFGQRPCSDLLDPIRSISRLGCVVYLVAPMLEIDAVLGSPDCELVDGVPLIRLRPPAFLALSWRLKRIFDITVSVVALVAVAPLLGIAALAVRWETGPGVIFRQERIGLGGAPFVLYKFRSLKPIANEGDVTWNIDTDSRIGPVGRLIRATSIDELPQLINILKGDMSLVGPRPERPYYVDQFSATVDGYAHRHRMPAGLTGFAVVHGLRGDTSIQDRSYFDNLYAESWSLWLDMKIMIRTGSQVGLAVGHRLMRKPG